MVLISDSQGRSTFVAVVDKNKLLAKENDTEVVNKLLKVVKRDLQHQSSRLIDQCTLICYKLSFFGTLFFNFQKFWGGSSPPCPSPCYGPDIGQIFEVMFWLFACRNRASESGTLYSINDFSTVQARLWP